MANTFPHHCICPFCACEFVSVISSSLLWKLNLSFPGGQKLFPHKEGMSPCDTMTLPFIYCLNGQIMERHFNFLKGRKSSFKKSMLKQIHISPWCPLSCAGTKGQLELHIFFNQTIIKPHSTKNTALWYFDCWMTWLYHTKYIVWLHCSFYNLRLLRRLAQAEFCQFHKKINKRSC